MRTNVSYARGLVFKRDRGICQECGFDTHGWDEIRRTWKDAMDRVLSALNVEKWNEIFRRPNEDRDEIERAWSPRIWAVRDRWDALGLVPHGWEMDHVVPVVEGGGECGLDNLRTLCIPCHRRNTAELARRRAETRRRQMRLEVG